MGPQPLDALDVMVQRHKAGTGARTGLTSVCSAHPLVIEAAVLEAVETGGALLVEATSNQVDQDGGYTGLRPAQFRDLVHGIAERHHLPLDRVVLGGDHLGPNRWRALPADRAMAKAATLVAEYVRAGFTKIHLDCSFLCAGDPDPLTDETVAGRAARLLDVAESTAAEHGLSGLQRYVVGTEVPVPGGAHESLDRVLPTTARAARDTLAAHRQALAWRGLDDVWPRVCALVVQPGVEFDHAKVVDYDRSAVAELKDVLDDEPNLVFEAHSTDYQTGRALQALVEDHWAILKVGPWLTFALREALFALSAVEAELLPASRRSRLPDVVESAMTAHPEQWQGYYEGDAEEQRLARRYSFSDRLRYYWPDPAVVAAETALLENLERSGIPLPLLSQFLPRQFDRVRDGVIDDDPRSLVVDRVRDVLRIYARAGATTVLEENR